MDLRALELKSWDLRQDILDIIMAGGVTSSSFIRRRALKRLDAAGINAVFDENGLAQDNAVGISVLGGKEIWGSNL